MGVVGANRRGARPFTELQSLDLAEVVWNTTPQTVRAPYAKGQKASDWISQVAPDPGKPV